MLKRIDPFLFIPALFLTALGSVMLSSVAPTAYPLHFLYLAVSLLAFLLVAQLNLRVLESFALSFYGISIFLLVFTLLVGESIRGSVRWINIGSITIQTSEIVKPLLLVSMAWILANINSNKRFILAFLSILIPWLLVFIQPDLGSSLVLISGFLGAVFIAGIPNRFIIVSIILGLILLPLSWNFLAPYQKARVVSFVNPESDPLSSGYNAIQAKIAVGGGGFLGQGLGQGTQSQLLFLPERHTDFIFAAISEELGFLGASLIVLSFSILLWRIVILIKNEEDLFAKSILAGIFMVIFIQSAINIGMNLSVLPVTGIPLPFVSSGGSSLLAMSATLGLASSLSTSLRRHGF